MSDPPDLREFLQPQTDAGRPNLAVPFSFHCAVMTSAHASTSYDVVAYVAVNLKHVKNLTSLIYSQSGSQAWPSWPLVEINTKPTNNIYGKAANDRFTIYVNSYIYCSRFAELEAMVTFTVPKCTVGFNVIFETNPGYMLRSGFRLDPQLIPHTHSLLSKLTFVPT